MSFGTLLALAVVLLVLLVQVVQVAAAVAAGDRAAGREGAGKLAVVAGVAQVVAVVLVPGRGIPADGSSAHRSRRAGVVQGMSYCSVQARGTRSIVDGS